MDADDEDDEDNEAIGGQGGSSNIADSRGGPPHQRFDDAPHQGYP